jgi:3',5'-cyclic AMP phosphodiesterase CpdA
MKNDPFVLAHVSDLHLCLPKGLRFRELLNKRIMGWLSWWFHRRRKHSDTVLKILCRDLLAMRPDHIAVSGDLTHLGTSLEISKALEFLKRLGPPEKITVVPGNHDAYAVAGWDPTFSEWNPYLGSDRGQSAAFSSGNPSPVFPIIRVRRHVAVIGVTTAQPCAPFFAVGRVGLRQLRSLETVLEQFGRNGLFRAVVIHHPPVGGIVAHRKRLVDAKAFRAVIEGCGAELILHGHSHRSSFAQLKGRDGVIPVIGAASASTLDRRTGKSACHHVFRIYPHLDRWEIEFSDYVFCPETMKFVRKCIQEIHVVRQPHKMGLEDHAAEQLS